MVLIEWLRGKKTYLLALAAGVLTALRALELIDDRTYETLLGLVGAGGLAALRAGVSKTGGGS